MSQYITAFNYISVEYGGTTCQLQVGLKLHHLPGCSAVRFLYLIDPSFLAAASQALYSAICFYFFGLNFFYIVVTLVYNVI